MVRKGLGQSMSESNVRLDPLARRRIGLRAVDNRRHPVRRAPGQSGVDRLLLEVVNYWSRCEALTIAQAVDIDDRLRPRRQFRDCCDEDRRNDGRSKNRSCAFRSDNFPRATNRLPKPRIGLWGPQRCADYDYGRTSTCRLAADCLLEAAKAEDAHEGYRSDIRPNGPCRRISGPAAPVSTCASVLEIVHA